ncbi:MAG: homocysteine S-methyltransferase family protein [Treponema sp.]|jgi:5-methyltetrahydrofolate--homocysteine methyltransferase|nr:homocysteine S-methyltransferase family protein [Treponema sp.]
MFSKVPARPPEGGIRETLNSIAARRIIILDGAMGSLIQGFRLTEEDFRGERFAEHPVDLLGCNDLLCLTRPDLIRGIHADYMKAGADITKTCSFNASSVSLGDFGIGELAYEISRAAAALARETADRFSSPERPRFVAGSMGPTAKSGSISPDIDDPEKRAIRWDELVLAYYDNARGLVDGGADILLVETIFDTLNAKAAISAIGRLLKERRIDTPVMLSATVASAGNGGRILSGQTLEAFCVSAAHAGPWSLGLNCSFGADKLRRHAEELGKVSSRLGASWLISTHPNAGLPNQLGGYDESPESMASKMEEYFKEGLLNIAGGCCGTTPGHIAAIAELAARYPPRRMPGAGAPSSTWLAGLEALAIGGTNSKTGGPDAGKANSKTNGSAGGGAAGKIDDSAAGQGFTVIGERTNVAGSRKFLKLIKEKNYGEALTVAREMIDRGAALIDVCMDDALLDAEEAMGRFLNLALQDPEIARVPIMIDSSRWNVIEAGLKCVQGKCLVNSISLKEGPGEFLRRAEIARSYGAAVVVMLFDERGQAADYERKIEVARRSWTLLRDSGFPAGDIVFDPNVLSVATGIPEHDSYGLDFIRACAWIHDNCPGAQISGGVSNLSFSFRGNDRVREALHAVFLKHAAGAGLSMAIVNPASLVEYGDIEEELRGAAEDLILNRNTAPSAFAGPAGGPGDSPANSSTDSPTERLLGLAERIAGEGASTASPGTAAPGAWRGQDAGERIVYAMVKGIDDYIEQDVLELRGRYERSLEIVEGPLMRGMREVGELFGEGKMFLPQVIRSARVMKKAVTVLTPFIEQEKQKPGGSAGRTQAEAGNAAIVLATVKGDVHDIGKNIVGVVLGCNGYAIRDLGVMVEAQRILDTAQREGAAAIGVSGLITPSLDEMVHIASEMERRGFNIPLLVGGAAASLAHTALRIAPAYSGPVVYTRDAGQCPGALRSLLSPAGRPGFLADLETRYREAAARHDSIHSRIEIIPLEEARANRVPAPGPAPAPRRRGLIELNDYPLEKIVPRIDWEGFLQSWELTPENGTGEEDRRQTARMRLLEDARGALERVQSEGLFRLRGVLGFFPAAVRGEDVLVFDPASGHGAAVPGGAEPLERFSFLRGQDRKRNGVHNPCLADFLPASGGWIGLFALSAGFGLEEAAAACRAQGDDYGAILLATLANSLAEAFSEEAHRLAAREYWGRGGPADNVSIDGTLGIRPAFGYPACPDHRDKEIAFRLLEAQRRAGLELTESAMIRPTASVCGMYLPGGFYFTIAAVGEDQLTGWAGRKGIGREEAEQRLASILPLAKRSF